MPFNIPRFELDITGTNLNNLIQDEPHTLSNRPVRAIAPKYGPFFAESLVVKNGSNILQRGLDYQIVELHQEATLRYGKEIASVILIINPNVSSNVTITYQVLGGHYAYDNTSIANAYQSVINDNRPVNWNDIFNKPTEYNPTIHRHLLDDIYGFEPIVDVLERIKRAITIGQADLVLEIIDNIIRNNFAYIREKFDKQLPYAIRFDDLLYYLTKNKLISKISVECETDEIYKGRSLSFEIDTINYDINQIVEWELITYEIQNLNIFNVTKGHLVTNNGKKYLYFYPHTGLGIDTNKEVYLAIRKDENQKDYLAISYRAKIKEAITTTDFIEWLASDYYCDIGLLNLMSNYNKEDLDEFRLFFKQVNYRFTS